MINPVTWFEIPVLNMDRAIKFYSEVLNAQLEFQDLGEIQMALFPMQDGMNGSSGALVYNEKFYKPGGDSGVLIYIECENVQATLLRVEQMNGEIVINERQISPEHGYMGLFIDSEGNRIALHAKTGSQN